MKKVIIGFLFVVLAAAAMPVSAKQAQNVEVLINKEVAARGGLKIMFVELVEDSRCPVDVDCVWAGNAKIKVRVTKNGKSKVLELNTMGRAAVPSYAGYRFKLQGLSPELRSNVRINRNAYTASIEITKVK
jgi:hypothetical protein